LPLTLQIARAGVIKAYGLQGAAFEASRAPETEITLFRVQQAETHSGPIKDNDLITTLAPFADLTNSIRELALLLEGSPYEVHGLGSLAGAVFRDADAMTGLISEKLLSPYAGTTPNQELCVPIRAIDQNCGLHEVILAAGGAPTLVTCKLAIKSRLTHDDAATSATN
jgi:hypothetical protein